MVSFAFPLGSQAFMASGLIVIKARCCFYQRPYLSPEDPFDFLVAGLWAFEPTAPGLKAPATGLSLADLISFPS
jgi:hypothetical protein